MNTVLFFQNLAIIASELAQKDPCLPWPKNEWKLSNKMLPPGYISPRKWKEAYDNYYGYGR